MTKDHFTEDDKQKFVSFLNAVAQGAKFNMDTAEIIKYFKLLSHMQQVIIPKIDANILEIRQVVEAEEKPEPKARK